MTASIFRIKRIFATLKEYVVPIPDIFMPGILHSKTACKLCEPSLSVEDAKLAFNPGHFRLGNLEGAKHAIAETSS
jgi:hypothetical protein